MAATVSSSSFAAVLKQSKFATFHPSIAQAYTVYGGSAHRGDWGLKRPLPVGRDGKSKKKSIFISAIDTREQQTWFDSAEAGVRNLRRWEEVGVEIRNEKSDAASRAKQFDSEFSTFGTPVESLQDVDGTSVTPTWSPELRIPYSSEPSYPNFAKMNKRYFDKYVERMREKKDQFRAVLLNSKEYIGYDPPSNIPKSPYEQERKEPPSMYSYSSFEDRSKRSANEFLKVLAEEHTADATSRVLEPFPHDIGGLQYTYHNPQQNRIFYPPVEARQIDYAQSREQRMRKIEASKRLVMTTVAGQVGYLNSESRTKTGIVDYTRTDRNKGVTKVRISEALLKETPKVVSNGEFIGPETGSFKLLSKLYDVNEQWEDHIRPGSYAWVSRDVKNKRQQRPEDMGLNRQRFARNGSHNSEGLDMIDNMLGHLPKPKKY